MRRYFSYLRPVPTIGEGTQPTSQRLSSRLKLALLRLGDPFYASLLTRNPRAAFWLTGLVGRWTKRLSWISPSLTDREVGNVFGPVARDRWRTIAREIRSVQLKNRALLRLLERDDGLETILPLIRWYGEDRLLDLHRQGRPAVLLLWHLGASYPAMVPSLLKLGVPTLFMAGKQNRIRALPELFCDTGGGRSQRVAAFIQAVGYARSGGLVALAPDTFRFGFGDGAVETSCFGRRIKLLAGFAAIARAADADVIPVVASWEQGGRAIGVRVYEPLPRPNASANGSAAFGEALVGTAAAWVENYLSSAPGEIGRDLLEQLLGAPLTTVTW